MVDFAAVRLNRMKSMTPEKRQLVEEAEAREDSWAETERPIMATFERVASMPVGWKPPAGPAAKAVQAAAPPIGAGRVRGFGGRVTAQAPRQVVEPSLPKVEEKLIRIRLEDDRERYPDRVIVRFLGAVTGHESYSVDEGFRTALDQARDRHEGRWFVCAGTSGRWDACSVQVDDIVSYLDEMLPTIGLEPVTPVGGPRP